MRTNVTLQLIRKDCWLHSPVIILSIVGGAIGLAILSIGGQTPFVFGAALFLISMGVCATVLPMSNIINERKKQTLPFVMSLPISSARYGVAKFVSTLGMFLITWLTLIVAAVYMIHGRHVLPNGIIPSAVILASLPFVGACLITGTALVGESERWGSTVAAIVNSSYWIGWYLLATYCPTVTHNWTGPVAVWNPAALNILGAEFAAVVAILGLTLLLQSRKRNFI
jgi:hypothetical protein